MTLASHRDQNRALGLPETSSPMLLNGWVADEPVAIWESEGRVCIAGSVKYGAAGSAAFELDEERRPAEDLTFPGEPAVTVSRAGEVAVHGGPDAQPIEAEFSPVPSPTPSESPAAHPSS